MAFSCSLAILRVAAFCLETASLAAEAGSRNDCRCTGFILRCLSEELDRDSITDNKGSFFIDAEEQFCASDRSNQSH